MTEMKIGTRRLQKGRGAYILNIPMYAVRTLGLLTGDELSVVLMDDGALRIEKEHNPATGTELGGTIPAQATQRTSQEGVANV